MPQQLIFAEKGVNWKYGLTTAGNQSERVVHYEAFLPFCQSRGRSRTFKNICALCGKYVHHV